MSAAKRLGHDSAAWETAQPPMLCPTATTGGGRLRAPRQTAWPYDASVTSAAGVLSSP